MRETSRHTLSPIWQLTAICFNPYSCLNSKTTLTMPHKRTTQSDVAKSLNLSTQTVSMALRGHKRIAKATRKRVAEAAKKMGYIPDPTLSALAHYRTQVAKKQTKWERVALLHDWESADGWLKHSHYRQLHTAIKSEADLRGIQVDEFWVGPKGSKISTVLRTLRARGIQSIILAPPSEGEQSSPIQIPKSQFHIVTFGPDSLYPDLHVIQFDYYENLRLAWRKLWDQGYRRIGLTYKESLGWRTNHAWLAAYLAEKQLANIPAQDLPEMIHAHEPEIEALLTWINTHQLDAVISPRPDSIAALQQSTPHVKVISMHQVGNETGVNPNPEHAAFAALELLQFEIEHALLKKSTFNLRTHIPGRWIERESL